MASCNRFSRVAARGAVAEHREVFNADGRAIGRRIAAAREEAGLTNASEFARMIGVAPNSVYRYERGEQVPKSEVLYRIAQCTRRSMEWLLAGDAPDRGAVMQAWVSGPTGGSATPEELEWMSRIDLAGYTPSEVFFDMLLSARRHGLRDSDAVRAASATTVAHE